MADKATIEAGESATKQLDSLFEEIDTVIANAPTSECASHLTDEHRQALVLLERAHDKLSEFGDPTDPDTYPDSYWRNVHSNLRSFFTGRQK